MMDNSVKVEEACGREFPFYILCYGGFM